MYGSKTAGVNKAEKKPKPVAQKLRGLMPGTILILLSAVYWKQLESGLLLATGPHSVNEVPLRPVNQRY